MHIWIAVILAVLPLVSYLGLTRQHFVLALATFCFSNYKTNYQKAKIRVIFLWRLKFSVQQNKLAQNVSKYGITAKTKNYITLVKWSCIFHVFHIFAHVYPMYSPMYFNKNVFPMQVFQNMYFLCISHVFPM